MTIIAIATGTQKPVQAFLSENEQLRSELGELLHEKFSADQSLDEMMSRYVDDIQRLKEAEGRVADLEAANAALSAELSETRELSAMLESSLDLAETFLDRLRLVAVNATISHAKHGDSDTPPMIVVGPNFMSDLNIAQCKTEEAMNKVRDKRRSRHPQINVIAARINLK